MKCFRHGPKGAERPGVIDPSGVRRDITGVLGDFSGASLAPDQLARLRGLDFNALPEVSEAERLGPCVSNVRNFVAVGLNYIDHAIESGLTVPPEPVLFNKAPSCVVGPNDTILIPEGSRKTDWEVERSCPNRWCNFGGLITAISGGAGSVRLPCPAG